MNVIDYFDQTRIISSVTRTDRRKQTIAEFVRNGFKVNTETVKFFDAITPKDAKDFPNTGVRGCFLSHLSVLEEAQRSQVNNILIVEDDIQFSKHIASYGPLAVESLQQLDWDIAYFGHTLEPASGEATWKKRKENMLTTHFLAINGKSLEKLTGFLNQMLMRPAGHPDGGPMHYDGALNTFMDQNQDTQVYYYSVNLGYQRPSQTDLHTLSILDENPMLRPLMAMARQFKAQILRKIR